MSDDSVQREVEENNERQDAEQDDKGITGLLDDAISPVTDAIGREDVDQETRDERAAGNDADQRP